MITIHITEHDNNSDNNDGWQPVTSCHHHCGMQGPDGKGCNTANATHSLTIIQKFMFWHPVRSSLSCLLLTDICIISASKSLVCAAVRSNTTLPSVASVAMPDEEEDDQEDSAAERASWSRERTIAETLASKLVLQWQGPISTLSRAGKAFEGLEALLGGAQGGSFDLGVGSLKACKCSCLCDPSWWQVSVCMYTLCVCVPVSVSVLVSVCLSVCLSVSLSLCSVVVKLPESTATLQDFVSPGAARLGMRCDCMFINGRQSIMQGQTRTRAHTMCIQVELYQTLYAVKHGGTSFAMPGKGLRVNYVTQGALWQRKGWKEMDKMRAQLEDLRELRDLVRSLGRGGGWGPLRRAPVQYLDMKGRPGLLRTILEQQETRGLTRSDDISRLLPSEVRPFF